MRLFDTFPAPADLKIVTRKLSEAVHMRRIDPTRNMARFYEVSLEPSLFGTWAVVRRWGRIGCQGRHIAFNGDYVWPAEPFEKAFRPLRNPRADFLNAA